MNDPRVGYLGPEGSFSHEAVLSLGEVEPVAYVTIEDLLAAVTSGEIARALVPMENALEGTVSAAIDGLVFDHDLIIVQEVVLPIHLHLLARAGVRLEDVTVVRSFVHALAQVRQFLHDRSLRSEQSTSTSQAARDVAASPEPLAAVASTLAADMFHLEFLARDIEDHPGNATRFVLVGRDVVAAPTGHDRTSVVCFQDADRPGSLFAILGRFAARDLNLTKLESRPTKRALGDYCFVIEFEGHVDDDVVADCLVDLQAHLARVKFLGSYPVTGEGSHRRRREVDLARRSAIEWIDDLRSRVSMGEGGASSI